MGSEMCIRDRLHMGATNSRSFRGVEVSTLSHIAILLLISILAIIHLKPIVQPLVVATLLFFLIRPPAQWLEEKYGHPLAAYGILTTGVVMVFFFAGNLLYQSLQAFSGEAAVLEEKMTEKIQWFSDLEIYGYSICLLYTSPSPRDLSTSRMPSSA